MTSHKRAASPEAQLKERAPKKSKGRRAKFISGLGCKLIVLHSCEAICTPREPPRQSGLEEAAQVGQHSGSKRKPN